MDTSDGEVRGRQVGFSPFVRRALIALLIVAVALFLWMVRALLLLTFLAVLLAVLLRGMAVRLSRLTRLPVGWSLAVACLLIIGFFVGMGFVLGPRLSSEFRQLATSLPDTWQALEQQIRQTPLGSVLPEGTQTGSPMQMLGGGSGSLFSRVTGLASVLANTVVDVFLVIAVAIFLAGNPGLYRRGILALVPPARQERVRDALDATGEALWLWLIGKLIAMVIAGVLTWAGLSLIGAPLPLVLGVIAGVFDFVTFVGPLAAAVPGVLLSLTVSFKTAALAALVYFVVQQIQGNVVEPLVQRKAVSLPPALTVLAAVGFGLAFGLLGLIVGVPLALTVLVLVKVLYVEGTLHEQTKVPGRAE